MAKILVIDDDAATRLLLEVQLQQMGHVMVGAAHGEQGLLILASLGVELIITDIFMPEKDGFEFILEFLLHPPLGVDPATVPIIAMTGHDMVMCTDLLLRTARKFGAREVLQKPFTATALKEKIERLLNVSEK